MHEPHTCGPVLQSNKKSRSETNIMMVPRIFAAFLAAWACTSLEAAANETPKKGGVLNFAVVAEPPNYDCHGNSTFGLAHPIFPHYSTLIRYTGDWKSMKIEGDLAESWAVSPDGLAFTFKLHKGVKFHDGSPLTSADVKATYERIINPPTGVVSTRRALYEDVSAIETPDDHTVIFKIRAPNASMLDGFASPWNCIYSAAKLKENPRHPETNIMGTGAFALVEHVKGSSWEGKRFDGYFRKDRPYLDGYKAFFVKSAALATGLIGGQFDIELRGLTPGERDQVVDKMKESAVLLEGPWSASLMLTINAKKKPFDDVRVRQALSLAIDRWGGAPAMAKISLMKFVGGFSRPGYEYGLTDSELEKLPGYGRDINASREQAKKLLAEAGVKDLKLNFLNRSVGQPYTAAGIYSVDQWKRIGVEADHKQLETKLFFDGLARGEFDVAMDFITDHADDPNLQYVHVVSEAMNNPQSYSKHSDLKIDELFQAQKRELDPAKRKLLTKDFERYSISQAYNIMLFWWQRIVVHNKKIKGWKLTPSHYLGNDLTEVWLDQ
jgi:peptide/nickel transport system substrate-binding protein